MLLLGIKLIQYERIDVSKGIDHNKAGTSKECMLYHYWYLKDIGYEYEQYVCNGCHDLSVMVYDLDYFMILNIKVVDYRCFAFNISKKKRNQTIK